jgi:hypothetical protein
MTGGNSWYWAEKLTLSDLGFDERQGCRLLSGRLEGSPRRIFNFLEIDFLGFASDVWSVLERSVRTRFLIVEKGAGSVSVVGGAASAGGETLAG